MARRWIRKPTLLAMGLLAAVAGCSDQAADKDTAVLVPDPSAPLQTKPATPPTAKPDPAAKPEPGKSASVGPFRRVGQETLPA